MSGKRLSPGGDKVVLADAARARKAMRWRNRQTPVLTLFGLIAVLWAIWAIYSNA